MNSALPDFGIVVGIDGSPESLAAVRWATAEAVLRRLPLTLLHVVPPVIVSWAIEAVVSGHQVHQEAHADSVIQAARQLVQAAAPHSPPPQVRVARRHNDVVTELTDASRTADMVVIGSRGLGRVGGAMLGSVSRNLLHHAHCPVVIAKEGAVGTADRDLPILLGIDGTPASEAATAFAFDEASRRAVDLVVLHAWSDVALFPILGMDWHTHEDRGREILAERLAGWQEQYPDVMVHRRLVCDMPARWLLDESRRSQLVVLGCRGRGGASALLLGSVSTAVAERAPTPVVVVRP